MSDEAQTDRCVLKAGMAAVLLVVAGLGLMVWDNTKEQVLAASRAITALNTR